MWILKWTILRGLVRNTSHTTFRLLAIRLDIMICHFRLSHSSLQILIGLSGLPRFIKINHERSRLVLWKGSKAMLRVYIIIPLRFLPAHNFEPWRRGVAVQHGSHALALEMSHLLLRLRILYSIIDFSWVLFFHCQVCLLLIWLVCNNVLNHLFEWMMRYLCCMPISIGSASVNINAFPNCVFTFILLVVTSYLFSTL